MEVNFKNCLNKGVHCLSILCYSSAQSYVHICSGKCFSLHYCLLLALISVEKKSNLEIKDASWQQRSKDHYHCLTDSQTFPFIDNRIKSPTGVCNCLCSLPSFEYVRRGVGYFKLLL